MQQSNIAADFVNQYYIDDGMLSERSQTMKNGLFQSASLNEYLGLSPITGTLNIG